jgi:hypothetical protein
VFIFRLLPSHALVYPPLYKIEKKKSESCARAP